MKIETFYDPTTFTLTYIVFDQKTKDAIIIDPVLDFHTSSSTISSESANKTIDYIKANNLKLHYILETHAHADHLTGSQILKRSFPDAKVAIGSKITIVQDLFKGIFNFNDLPTDGSQFDQLLNDNQVIKAGTLELKVMHTPGHTPACSSYLVNNEALFVGDALFMPDMGTGRCDFPKGSATELYHSIHGKMYKLPDNTKVYVGHDYQPGGRALAYQTTIGESKENNIQLKEKTRENEFVSFRTKRDASLEAPRILLPSIQFNIRAGKLPPPEENGTYYMKYPINGADILKEQD